MLMVLGSTIDPAAGAAKGARVACAPTVVPGRITALAPTVPWSPILMGAQAMLVLSTAMLAAILQVSPFTTLHRKPQLMSEEGSVPGLLQKQDPECRQKKLHARIL